MFRAARRKVLREKCVFTGEAALASSETPREKQDDNDDQDDADETVAAVTKAIAGAAETATEATKQEDDEDNDEDGSQRHDRVPLQDIRIWLLSLKSLKAAPDSSRFTFWR